MTYMVRYSEEVAATILRHLAEGRSLKSICRDDGMPTTSTVLEWVDTKPDFADQYTQARARGYQLLAEEILEISDDSAGDSFTDDNGIVHTDAERVARSKLRVDSRKWLLSKMLPKVYGDKQQIEHSGNISLSDALREAKAKRRGEA